VFAGVEGLAGEIEVQLWRHCDDDGVDGRIVDRGAIAFVARHAAELPAVVLRPATIAAGVSE